MKRTGDRFEVFKDGTRWYWRLIVSHSPSPTPVAKSGRGYPSLNTALAAVKSARLAAASAPSDPVVIER